VREREREEAINRAKALLRGREPRVRNFHSQLLIANVLHERDAQLEQKAHQLLCDKIEEKEEILKMRKLHLRELEKAKQSEAKVNQTRLAFALELRENIHERSKHKDDRNDVKKFNSD
jgi:hypothetical protein